MKYIKKKYEGKEIVNLSYSLLRAFFLSTFLVCTFVCNLAIFMLGSSDDGWLVVLDAWLFVVVCMVLFESNGFDVDADTDWLEDDVDVDDDVWPESYWDDLDDAEFLACTSVYSLALEKYSS